jgi:hypothetical protein
MALSENGYTSYAKVPADTEFPAPGAPEKNFPERTGDNTSWKGGPRGLQPGFDLPGISPMAPGFGALFGYFPRR